MNNEDWDRIEKSLDNLERAVKHIKHKWFFIGLFAGWGGSLLGELLRRVTT